MPLVSIVCAAGAIAKAIAAVISSGLSGSLCGFDSTRIPRVGGRRPAAGPRAREAVTCESLGPVATSIWSRGLICGSGGTSGVGSTFWASDDGLGASGLGEGSVEPSAGGLIAAALESEFAGSVVVVDEEVSKGTVASMFSVVAVPEEAASPESVVVRPASRKSPAVSGTPSPLCFEVASPSPLLAS